MSAYVAPSVKPLAFDIRTVDLSAADHHAPAFAGLSLTSRVPTLVHGDFALSESSAIAVLNRLVLNGDAVPPRLADYARRQWRHPAVQRWVAFERPPL